MLFFFSCEFLFAAAKITNIPETTKQKERMSQTDYMAER